MLRTVLVRTRSRRYAELVCLPHSLNDTYDAHKCSAQVTAGVVICCLAAGIVFGFAALKQVLVQEGVYRDLCTAEELARDEPLCYLQDQKVCAIALCQKSSRFLHMIFGGPRNHLWSSAAVRSLWFILMLIPRQLNLIFIIGSVTTNLSALLVGSVLDRYGPFPCGIISCIVIFLGSLCMACAPSLPFDAYALGYFLLALGGTFTFVPSFHLANAFPQLQGLILSLITGAFDASAAVFLGFRLLYEASDGTFDVQAFFRIYLIVPLLMLVAYLFLMPRQSYETRSELENQMEKVADNTMDVHDSDDELDTTAELYRVRAERAAERAKDAAQIVELIGDQNEQIEHEIKEDEKKIASGVWGKELPLSWSFFHPIHPYTNMTPRCPSWCAGQQGDDDPLVHTHSAIHGAADDAIQSFHLYDLVAVRLSA
jgi:MFS family permease